MPVSRIDGAEWRVSPQGVTRRVARGPWQSVTRAEILALDVDGIVWEWLREQGVKRSSATSSQPETEREAKQVLLRLLPAQAMALDALAKRRGQTRSEAVASLVEAAGEVLVQRGRAQSDASGT